MGSQLTAPQAVRYRAFISYSHADATFARWLHRSIESCRLPAPDGGSGERLSPVFIDRAEMAAGADLTAQVREALGESAALVVVASPHARASKWVGQEIALFRALHPDRAILTALAHGEPAEAFPDVLLAGTSGEPLAADFRKGQDGRRLGLLKIIAGLSGLPLDRLVQRDVQARQRRVMAVTAGALLLSLVLAALLVFALRARAEAERQRGEAEGMVEFMLTDLRDKLKGAGSLKAMSAVNARALEYYARQNLARLGDDSLDRRARVLHAMGEDDERLGAFAAAQAKYAEARRSTAAVLARRPADPDALFAHAQSEYWVGEAAWQQGDTATTARHWQAYRDLAGQLARVEPGSKRALMEQGYATGNLCELAARTQARPEAALPLCEAASDFFRRALARAPGDAEVALALANRLGWQADAQLAAGRHEPAIALRHEEAALLDSLLSTDPDNARYRERRLWPEIGIARVLTAAGRDAEALPLLRRCLSEYDALAAGGRGDDTLITEQRMRVAWMLAMSGRKAGSTEAPHHAALARTIYRELARTHTPAQMVRFDKMMAKLEQEEQQ